MIELVPTAKEHLASIAAIERICFREPWSEQALEILLQPDRIASFSALENGTLVGYGSMLLTPFEGQILNVAVHPDARRRGVGKALLNRLVDAAKKIELESVSLEVRVSNQAAIALYRSFGFEIAGTRTRFYRFPPEDAYTMVLPLRHG